MPRETKKKAVEFHEEDAIAKMVNAYHNEKSNDIDTDLSIKN